MTSEKRQTEVNQDTTILCVTWIAVDMSKDDDKAAKVCVINALNMQKIWQEKK